MENIYKCEVVADNERNESTDFIAVLAKEDGNAQIFYNTDALTVGIAIKLLTNEYVKMMQDLDEKERYEILEILGDAFNPDKICEDVRDVEEFEETKEAE